MGDPILERALSSLRSRARRVDGGDTLSLRGWIERRAMAEQARTSRWDAQQAGFSPGEIDQEFGVLPTGFEMTYEDKRAVVIPASPGFERGVQPKRAA